MELRRTVGTCVAILGAALAIAPPASSQAPRRDDGAVYRAVLDSLFAPARTDLVASYYLPSASGGRSVPAAPPRLAVTLRAALDSALAYRGGSPKAVLGRWHEARWVKAGQVRAHRRARGAPPRVTVSLSRIGYAPDNSEAALYVTMLCGTLCGREELVVLGRASDGAWRIREIILLRVS